MTMPPGQWVKWSNGAGGNNCVEARHVEGSHVEVRNSKRPDGPRVAFSEAEWKSFVEGAKGGAFDIA